MIDQFRVLGLSEKSLKILRLVRRGFGTPVQLAKQVNISRPAIYAILKKLEAQGVLVQTGEKNLSFEVAHLSQINSLLEATREALVGDSKERKALYEEEGLQVNVYRGKDTIKELMRYIFASHTRQKCVGIQGANVYQGWKDILGVDFINDINKTIKKNRMINQPIVPTGHFEEAVQVFGPEWAEHFGGRTARTNEIDRKYFKHKGEIFLFKDAVYLVSMSESIVVEIKHSHIFKQLEALVEYIQDTSLVVDGNQRLREIISRHQQA